MEHPLRIRVFCAEVRAGMWRRNGDAPILFSEWYRSVRWSEQGQDLDLFLLQCCAALAPADLYLQRILERFGLSNYLSMNLEQSSEHEPVLVAEMLTLLIQIVKERSLSSLPRDLSKVDELQEVLDRVAEYSHPSGMTQGIAKIATCKTLLQIVRAVLFYAVFNDKLTTSRAPDGVLLTALHLLALALDVCRLHKESGDQLCYLGDVIPILAFASKEICTTKYGDQSMLSLLVLLMRMHEKENAQNFVEAGNFNLAPLVSSLIKTFVELEPGCMTKLHKLAPELASQFSHSILNKTARDKGSASDNEKRKAKSRERQAAIMEKMRAQQSKFLESFNSSGDDDMDDTKSEQEVCDSEVSNDIQESAEALSFANQGPPSWEQVSRSGKEHLEDLVQSAVNDFASIGQPQEVNAFTEFCKARFPSIKNVQLPCVSKDTSERPPSSLTLEEHMYLSIREFQSSLNGSDSQKRNEKFSAAGSSTDRSSSSEFLLLCKYIAALPNELPDNPSASQSGCSNSDRMKTESSMLHPGHHNIGPSGADGIYVSSCGHAVHQGCLDRYLSSLKERYLRRIVFEGGHIVDPDQGEFLCPVCRGLANSVLPALPGDLRKVPQPPAVPTISSSYSSSPSTSADMGGSLRLQEALSLLRRAANIAESDKSLKALPTRNGRIKPNLEPFLRILCGMYYPGQDKILETGRASHSLILWDTLKYTLLSAEIAARSGKSSLSPNYSISALYKELNASSGFILSLLLDVIQSMRTVNSLTVLLRFQGIELFARSLCCGTYPSEPSNHSSQQQGNMLYILENAEPEAQYPDIQLWRHASEPIVARDAFSSFMWLLFCLPWPTLFCRESYLSLVHVFYTVTVTQAIITCHKKRHSIETQLGSRDNLIMDIYRVMGECQAALQCFDSYYIDPAYDITDAIRSLTFPYLRRCALLWKLINSSNIMPFSDGVHSWGGSPFEVNDWNCTTDTGEELRELEKLEKMFNIPSLDLVVNDEELRSTALRWMGHFCEVFEAHKSQCVLRCTPAVPFKLMLLPHLYQDLLQRYIKKSCPDCGDVKEEPALCLLCGKLCSPNWKTCCRESGCQTHAMACGAGIGVFLLIRRTTILLQRSARQAPWPSPYLDAFGEEDVEMHRGKPLFLNEERYAALTHMSSFRWSMRVSGVLLFVCNKVVFWWLLMGLIEVQSWCSILILSSEIMFDSGARTEDLRTVAVFVSRVYRLHKDDGVFCLMPINPSAGEYMFAFIKLGS
ncbi:E3 ubiquitin-protein ligase PRT6 [Sesamum angolense]|uniref:E3 ubiquitin-protein ligase n=1 Tax=Sesamum angolense TaxID=2727404 RepID=A0AAE1WFD1_9LAMI|nr:E3 ubiquitin-protein ligase PRT6 [Sesamum angolense]